MEFKDYYQLMGVDKNATQSEIKKKRIASWLVNTTPMSVKRLMQKHVLKRSEKPTKY